MKTDFGFRNWFSNPAVLITAKSAGFGEIAFEKMAAVSISSREF